MSDRAAIVAGLRDLAKSMYAERRWYRPLKYAVVSATVGGMEAIADWIEAGNWPAQHAAPAELSALEERARTVDFLGRCVRNLEQQGQSVPAEAVRQAGIVIMTGAHHAAAVAHAH